MSIPRLSLGETQSLSDTISSEMFGANTVFTKDYLTEGGAFDDFIDRTGATSLRFPGGTVTEQLFDPSSKLYQQFWNDETASVDGKKFVTSRELFEYTSENDYTVDWVLPTEHFFSDRVDENGNRIPSERLIDDLMDKVEALVRGDYGHIEIDTITIGNEYWYQDSRETAGEYGKMVEAMAPKLQAIFDAHRETLVDPDAWVEPKIAMQTTLGYEEEEVPLILDEISISTRGLIDTVETHYYRAEYNNIDGSTGTLDRLDDIADAKGFGELDYYVSEWNVMSSAESDHGMEHASSFIEMFDEMAKAGVDQASVWGTTYKSLWSRLAVQSLDADAPGGTSSELTAAGEVMRMMSNSLVGTQAVELDIPEHYMEQIGQESAEDQLLVHAFKSDAKTVVFLSSRSADGIDLKLDVDELVGDYHYFWGQQLSVIDNPDSSIDEGDPTAYLSRPIVENFNGYEALNGNGTINVELGGYDIVKLEFATGDEGLTIYGHDNAVDEDTNFDDKLNGTRHSDTILGELGDDKLFGLSGHDYIDGGEGDDLLMGGMGHDTIITGSGNDRVFTGEGDDTVFALEGENQVTLNGGGAKLFVDPKGDTIINGFDVEQGHTLSFMGEYETLNEALQRMVIQDQDIIFLHDAGGQTELIGAAEQSNAISSAMIDYFDPEEAEEYIETVLNGGGENGLADILENGSPDELQAYLNGLSADEKFEALIGANLDEMLDNVSADNLPILLNNLELENLETFLEEVSAGTLLEQIMAVGDSAREMFASFSPIAQSAYLGYLAGDLPDHVRVDPKSSEPEDDDRAVGSQGNDYLDDLPKQSQRIGERDDDFYEDNDDMTGETITGVECFVATAAYGDKFHPDVAYLRRVRDHVMVHYVLGRWFISAYWFIGPRLARWLAPYPAGRRLARAILHFGISAMRNHDIADKYDHGFKSSVYLSGRDVK